MSEANEPDPDTPSDGAFVDETVSRTRSRPRGGLDQTVDASDSAPDSSGDETIDLAPAGRRAERPIERRFGDYELIEEIARGGMGVVYKARHVPLNRIVALKMILAGQFAGPQEVQRFLAEAQAAAQLDHPGIVPIYEIGTHDGQHFYAMGFVEGSSLAGRIAERPLSPHAAAASMIAIGEAVQYAHERGIVHRDLKPSNVLVDERGVPRVTDFGLAKRLQGGSDLTHSGQILGTPSYIPPEQAAGRLDQVGPRSDVYSLGAVLYCLLVGRPPFASANPVETLSQVINQEPVALRKFDASIPRDLETICLTCLEKNPAKRYASAQAMIDDLRRFVDREPIRARPLGLVGRMRRWLRRRPLATGCALLSVGVAMIVGSVVSAGLAVAYFSTVTMDAIEDRQTPAVTIPLDGPSGGTTDIFAVATEGTHELELRTKIVTPSYDLKLNTNAEFPTYSEDGEWTAADTSPNVEGKYNFPVRYDLMDDEGRILTSGTARIVWNADLRKFGTVELGDNVATLETSSYIAQFPGPIDGKAQVRIAIGEDDRYDALIETVEVVIYENVSDNRPGLTLGGAFCIASPILLAMGLILSIVGPALTATLVRSR